MKTIENNDLLTSTELARFDEAYSKAKSITELRKRVREDCEFENLIKGRCERMSFEEDYGISVTNSPSVNIIPKGFEVHFNN